MQVVVTVVGNGCFDLVDERRTYITENLFQDNVRPIGEVLVKQTLALGNVEIVDGIELATRLPLVHVATVVAPTGSLGIERLVNGLIDAVPDDHYRLLTQ